MDKGQLIGELQFKAVRSGGAGGQHVNKVSTKIELTFDLVNSFAFLDTEKERLLHKLKPRLTNNGLLLLQCDETRSQHRNKELIVLRFLEVIESALKTPKKRKRTKPSKASVEKRLKTKKLAAQKKSGRKKPNFE
ncbi:alternative ribosome rescue aminoacyl-tRNA hydrolase ArfB [Ulvibacterium marinum]|uniref:Aminoacyl-tRNA hydrolase n=1 Tax=Ulvibacterium marinum TaxID=2419782 RepID=A0A3B0C9A4_9FLAO|nr:alternative ribosome rescue aminoacyl-tRNA hydrolase ArfB [Ulvibacterium marinum]RKN82955.1 aminoacyl-tRNA hydrolase [Ulvibacterium marinum]